MGIYVQIIFDQRSTEISDAISIGIHFCLLQIPWSVEYFKLPNPPLRQSFFLILKPNFTVCLLKNFFMRIMICVLIFGIISCKENKSDKFKNMTIEERIRVNPDNALLFKFMEINTNKDSIIIKTKSNAGDYFYHEGLVYFWSEEGKMLPDSIKYLINGNGVMIIPETGKIFAAQLGFSDYAFRYNFSDSDISNSDELRVARNMDGIYMDIRPLKEDWVLGINFVGDTEKNLISSYNSNSR